MTRATAWGTAHGADTRPLRVCAAIAAFVVAAVAAGCGSATTSQPAASTPPACPAFGTTADASGPVAVTRSPAVALLNNVQVQASGCVDEVSFLFLGGLPGWSIGYRDGPLTEDPSGMVVQVAGAAHLVVRFQPAAGVDLAQSQPVTVYDGPTDMSPSAPSGVAELRRLGDFESVTSWAIGLDSRRPFQAVVRGDRLVVRLPAATRRPTRCRLAAAGVSIGYPSEWYGEFSDRWACQYFDPAPFVVHPATNDFRWAVTVEAADAPASEVVARIATGTAHVSSHPARVGGLAATVLDVTESGHGLLPAGFSYRMYVVDTGPRALTITGAAAPPGSPPATSRANVDRFAALVQPG
jgi:hypothetical protein